MLDFTLNTLVYILAIYGIIEIIKTVYYIMEYTNLSEDGIYIIIATKNQEGRLEGILRSILFKIMYGKEDEIKKVILTDLSSKDNTFNVLKKFKRENDYVAVSTWKECKEIIDMIDKTEK